MSRALKDAVRRSRRTHALHVLILVIGIAGALVAADVLRRVDSLDLFRSELWNTDADRSLIEVVGYVVTGAAAVLLGRCGRQWSAAPVLIAWAVVLVLVVADDALEGHERGGEWLTARAGEREWLGLRTQDVGELGTWAALGVLCVLVVLIAHRRSGTAARRASWGLLGAAVLLLVPAVGVDVLGVAVQAWSVPGWLIVLLVFVEAAGELIGMGAFLALAVHFTRAGPAGVARLTP